MNKSFFITGTNTDVGKTTCAIWLARRLDMHYYKPVETGESDYEMVKSRGVNCYPPRFSLPYPSSPHISARLAGIDIDINSITLPQSSNLIVEGAGGVFVPLSNSDKQEKQIFMIDLIKWLKLPVLIIGNDKLGALNEVILTKFALDFYHIPVIGVILNKFTENTLDNARELSDILGIEAISLDLREDNDLPSFLKKTKI